MGDLPLAARLEIVHRAAVTTRAALEASIDRLVAERLNAEALLADCRAWCELAEDHAMLIAKLEGVT